MLFILTPVDLRGPEPREGRSTTVYLNWTNRPITSRGGNLTLLPCGEGFDEMVDDSLVFLTPMKVLAIQDQGRRKKLRKCRILRDLKLPLAFVSTLEIQDFLCFPKS
jgi:hypothetical protein